MLRNPMMRQGQRVFVAGAIALLAAAPVRASSRSLSVNINGLKSQQGQVCLSLFRGAQGFPMSASQAVAAKCVAVGQAQSVTFGHLAAGSYAIAVFHDVNNDGTLNRNPLGIPTEGFGFSRNPQIFSGPPAFGDSAVVVNNAGQRIQIRLQYLLGG